MKHVEQPPELMRAVSLSLAAYVRTSREFDLSTIPVRVTSGGDCQILSPKPVSIPITAPRISARGFTFQQTPSIFPATSPNASAAPETLVEASQRGKRLLTSGHGRTHIRLPGDIIKLKDRLFYVLQPSLETLITGATLDMPQEPFRYQLDGVGFLYPRHAAVLADEMGLGKTMQAITAVRLLLHAGEIRSVLLVCPKPLIPNWLREFAHWAPEIPVATVGGEPARRLWQWQLPGIPVTIANYELLVRDEELVTDGAVCPDLVVLDEAQRIKNSSSATSRVVRSVRRTRSWALTGTPIENSSEDLVGIFEFVSPGLLSSKISPRRLARATRDYILRRTKEEVLTELPPKLFRDAQLELTDEQRQTYELAEHEGVVRLNKMGERVAIQHVFELILRLKQICNFDPATGQSSKLERIEADLEEVAASGHQAIVFSQWVQSLDKLAHRLKRFRPLCYHGRVPPAQRELSLAQFRDCRQHRVLLMSYGAGSVGLNLQFANYVFLFDRWWNPAVEDQAINRAHRIGVTGPVTVTRLLMLDTIEQRIDDILQEKRSLVSTILSHSGGPAHLGLSQQDIFGLFRLRVPECLL